jgi:uncharacterized protein
MKRLRTAWLAFLLVLTALAASLPALAAPKFPPLTGRVVDEAGVLSAQTEAELTGKLEALEQQTGRQLVAVTISSLQGYEIEDYGYQLGRAWGIGDSKSDTGVLFVVAPNERRVRIEVGYGLEPVLTDAFATALLQKDVLPAFREDRIADGVVAGVDALVAHLSLPRAEAETLARARATGEAPTDLISLGFLLLILVWAAFGFLGAARGRGADYWIWPLLFMTHAGRGGRDTFHGRGGSFGGGGASGRW